MQYFGYLRRDPNVNPDSDYTGLRVLADQAQRLRRQLHRRRDGQAFISSTEYRQRFGPTGP
jgi:hypothetical protein